MTLTVKTYFVLVRYRTKSGCNSSIIRVDTDDMARALRIARNKVERRRRVVHIDGAECLEPTEALAAIRATA
jgi:hypothetical protein